MKKSIRWIKGLLLIGGLLTLLLDFSKEVLGLELLLLYYFLDEKAIPKTRPTSFQVLLQSLYVVVFPILTLSYGTQERYFMAVVCLGSWLVVMAKCYLFFRLWKKED